MPTDCEPRAASTAAVKKMSPPQADPKPEKKQSTAGTSTKSSNKRAHPTYQEMILNAIEEDGEKGAASRPVIKKYILHRYGINDTHHFDAQIAAAIRRGFENGTFELPKGFGGKIKIAVDKNDHHKENAAPSTGAKKPAIAGGTARTRVLAKKTAAANKSTALKPKKKVSTSSAAKSSTAKKEVTAPAVTPAGAKKTTKAQGPVKKGAKTAKTTPTTVANKKKGAAKLSPTVELPAAKKKTVAAKSVAAKKAPAKTGAKKATVASKK